MFSEILGFYGLAYWYTWQVSMLGLEPIWMSKNEKIKQCAAELLKKRVIFAFGLSEKEHGTDLIKSRACDYMRSASDSDRRYLLYNPMVKMKVTIQGEEVINLLWDAIAAKGFEADTYFEIAARDIRGLPKLERKAHVNMVLINNFIEQFLFEPAEYPEIPERTDLADDSYLFHQGATTKGLKKIKFHDYKKAYNLFDTPNLKVFLEQVEAFKHFWKDSPISTSQARDLNYILAVGEMFILVPYGQLILERAQQWKVEKEVIDRIFDFMVRDFSKYAVQVYTKPSTTSEQMKNLLSIIKQPITKTKDFEYALRRYVYSQKGAYEMNP